MFIRLFQVFDTLRVELDILYKVTELKNGSTHKLSIIYFSLVVGDLFNDIYAIIFIEEYLLAKLHCVLMGFDQLTRVPGSAILLPLQHEIYTFLVRLSIQPSYWLAGGKK